MPAGDLIGRDRQAELGGVLLGEGTRFPVDEWDLFALPNVNTKDTERNDIGVMPGVDSYAGRLLTIEVWLDAFPDMQTMEADRAALESAFAPTNETRELHFRVDTDRYCYVGRGRGVSFRMPSLEPWTGQCKFLATDPRVFSGTEHVHTFDSGPATLTNDGTRQTPWVWRVEGQCIGPRLWRTDNIDIYAWEFPDLELADGDVLTVDSGTGTALVNGTSVIGLARNHGGVRLPFPFSFPAGDVEWNMDADGDSGFPTSTLSWRDAWA